MKKLLSLFYLGLILSIFTGGNIVPDTWTQAADSLWPLGAISIHCLHEFKAKLYGGAANSYLLEWNDVDTWVPKGKASHHHLYSLITFENKLYCGNDSGRVLIWNEVDNFTEEQNLGTDQIKDFLIFEGKLYCILDGGSAWGGSLWERGAGGVWTAAAPRPDFFSRNGYALASHTYINPVTHLTETRIFGAIGRITSGPSSYLCRWNGVDAWEIVATGSDAQGHVRDLKVLQVDRGSGPENILMGCTTQGLLLEWNGADAWIQRAPILLGRYLINAMTIIPVMGTETNVLIAVTTEGDLFRWNGADAWVQLVSPFLSKGAFSVTMYNDKVYGGTNGSPAGGYLLEWTPPPWTPPPQAAQICFTG